MGWRVFTPIHPGLVLVHQHRWSGFIYLHYITLYSLFIIITSILYIHNGARLLGLFVAFLTNQVRDMAVSTTKRLYQCSTPGSKDHVVERHFGWECLRPP